MENSQILIFDEIWSTTLYYSTWTLTQFLSNFNKFVKNLILIGISSNFIFNISTCICIRKCNKNSLLVIYSSQLLMFLFSDFRTPPEAIGQPVHQTVHKLMSLNWVSMLSAGEILRILPWETYIGAFIMCTACTQ